MRHPAPLPLLLALVVGLGLVAGAGAAPTPVAWRHATPPRGIRSRLPVRRPVNDSTSFNELNSENDVRWSSVFQLSPKREISSEEENVETKNDTYDLVIKPEDAPIKTWEDLKSKLMNKDFLGAEAREEVIRILLPPGKRNDTEELQRRILYGRKKQKDIEFRADSGSGFSTAGRAAVMACSYAVVALLAVIISWYALQPIKGKKSSPQPRRLSKVDSPDKEDLARTAQNPVAEASRVSIAADIMTARTDAAEKAHSAAARAAEQTSASQPLTPVGARVTDKMEVAEAVARERRSRMSLLESSSKVFGALPYRCRGIRLKLGRSVIVLEGFRERDVPQRRHSIIGIVRPGETSLPEIESRSLPDMKTLRETADEEMTRINTTLPLSQPLVDSTDESPANSDTTLCKEAVRISSKSIVSSGPAIHRGSMNLMGAPEAVRRGSLSAWVNQDSTATSSTGDSSSDESPQRERKANVSISQEPSEIKPHTRRSSFSSSPKSSKPPYSPLDAQERRASKTQHRMPFQRSRRGTLETVHSESIMATPEHETETANAPSAESFSDPSKGPSTSGITRGSKQPPPFKRSTSAVTASLSSDESLDESESKFSNKEEHRYIKTKSRKRAIKEALDQVEKIVDKITTPIVDSMRSAGPKKKSHSLSRDKFGSATSPSASTSSSPTKVSRSNVKSDGTIHIAVSGPPRLSEQETVLPRLWGSRYEETEDSDTQITKPKSAEDSSKVDLLASKGLEEKPTEEQHVLPRMWNSISLNGDEISSKDSPTSQQSSKDSKLSKDSKSTKQSSKFLSSPFRPKSPTKLESKNKGKESREKSSHKALEDNPDENTPSKSSNNRDLVYDTTSCESISGKSATETRGNEVPPSTNETPTSLLPTQSNRSIKTKSVLSKASVKSSRQKFPSEKRHGNYKRADGTPILPVSQATLQAIFYKKTCTDMTITEKAESDLLLQPESNDAKLKQAEGYSTTDYSSSERRYTSSSAESAVVVGSVLIFPQESEERVISSSSPVIISPKRSQPMVGGNDTEAI